MKKPKETWRLLPTPELISGPGAIEETGGLLDLLGVAKPMVVMTKGPESELYARFLKDDLERACDSSVVIFDEVRPDPAFELVQSGAELAKREGVDVVIALGGGSSIDAAKAIAALASGDQGLEDVIGENNIQRAAPLIAIPTTAGTGSEVTPIAILSDEKEQLKKGVVSTKIIPRYAILDPILTLGAPPSLTANTGLDALSHAVEAFTSRNATLLTDTYARKAITLILGNIRQAYHHGDDVDARYMMLLGSHLAGLAFSNAGVTAAHALAYPLGARYHIPHGASVLLFLPAVLDYNAIGSEDRFRELSSLFTGRPPDQCEPTDAVRELNLLCEEFSLPQNLEAAGVEKALIPEFADAAFTIKRLLRNNPREISTSDQTREIYERAYGYDRETRP